jgi:hypothetical protein
LGTFGTFAKVAAKVAAQAMFITDKTDKTSFEMSFVGFVSTFFGSYLLSVLTVTGSYVCITFFL